MEISTITLGILIGCFFALSWFAGSDAPFVPTRSDIISEVLKMAGVKKGKKFYELGSGDGRVVYTAAKLGAEAIGIEQSWIRVIYSKLQARQLHLANAHFNHGNVFKRQYPDADIVFIYLLPKGIDKLEKKLPKELKKGSIVITQTFHFKNWKPFKKIKLASQDKSSFSNIRGAGEFQFYRV